jgi:hypothetical protein
MSNFTTVQRKIDFQNFMKNLNAEYTRKTKTDDYLYTSVKDMFVHKKLASGVEGVVYISMYKQKNHFNMPLIHKVVNLYNIKESKLVSSLVLNSTPQKLYKLIQTSTTFNKPSLTEIVAQILVNQMVLQSICPHFVINYYWDYTPPAINMYNEYINSGTFDKWANEYHSDIEWSSGFFQIIVGLIAIKRYFNMTHCDFHTQNVLVHKVNPGGYWMYTIDNETYYLPNLGWVFVINDFGFAWVPKKLTTEWLYTSTLKHVTKSGRRFFDISNFINSIFANKSYKVPHSVRKFVRNSFYKDEISYIYTTDFYKKQHPRAKYPNINKYYNGLNTTLEDKLLLMYKNQSLHPQFLLNDKPKNQELIETYSLDKPFDFSKVPDNFKSFIVL